MVHSTNHTSILLLPARCLCTNPFSPTPPYTSSCSGYKESPYQQMDWGELGSSGQEGCQAVLVYVLVLWLSLSVFLSFSVSFVVCFVFLCPIPCYHQLQQLRQPRLLHSSSYWIFLFVLIGRLWEKQLGSDIQFSFKWPQLFWEQLWSSSSKTPLLHVGPSGKRRLRQETQPCPPSPASQLFSIFCPVSVWLGSCRSQDLWGKVFLPFSVCNMLYEHAARHRLFIVTAVWTWGFTGLENTCLLRIFIPTTHLSC